MARCVEVLVEAKVPHLARTFTYAVPGRWSDVAQPGVRVRVRLAGQRADGYVIGPADASFDGPVHHLESVVSAVPVLSRDILRLCEAVAEHYAGTVPDVVRLAVPPRVAGAERGWSGGATPPKAAAPKPRGWLARHAFVQAAAAGRPARAAWSVPAGTDWAGELAEAAAVVAAAGKQTIIVVPDARDLAAVERAVAQHLPSSAVAALSADAGPAQRYGEFLRALSGGVSVVVGTRAAAFAPLRDVGLVVVWNDGDASLAEQRAPYPHAREVLALRSHLTPCALLVAGHARSAEVQRWVAEGWAREIADRRAIRSRRPRAFAVADQVRSPFDASRRLPVAAVTALREGLASGPVLVQVARRGYVPVTACGTCRTVAECPHCLGPLELGATGAVSCRRCGQGQPFRCSECGGTALRAVRTGASRTAEELGRLFPDVPVVVSTAAHPVATVADEPAVVVSTAGVEPFALGGYRAGALLDAQDDLWRIGVGAREDALRRWLTAAALLRPAAPLAVNADPADQAVQALIRWDPPGFAAQELARRQELGLPPAGHVAQLDGAEADVTALIEAVAAHHEVDVLGPRVVEADAGEHVRALLRGPDFASLRTALHTAVLARAASHRGSAVRVQVDPAALE